MTDITRQPTGNALGDSIVRNITRHDRARADEGVSADRKATEDDRAGANGRALLDPGGNDCPVGVTLQAAGGGRPRVAVVDEHDAMADEDLVLDGDAFADEAV